MNKNKIIFKKIIFYLSITAIFIAISYLLMTNNDSAKKHNVSLEYEKFLVFDNYTDVKTITKKIKRYRNASQLTPNLHASASAQPNLPDLHMIIRESNLPSKQVFIVDLRQEPHGFLNEYAISWYGFRNQLPTSLEEQLIKELANKKIVKVHKDLNKLIDGYVMPKEQEMIKVNSALTEKNLVEKQLNANYFRVLVTDHFAPSDSQVDLFVKFVKKLPKISWLHFHCRGGKGRSTTFMVMYDIIKNGNQLSLHNILKRQSKLGGSDLSRIDNFLIKGKWKEIPAKERYNFIKKFYLYVLDPDGYNSCSWSEWLKKYSN